MAADAAMLEHAVEAGAAEMRIYEWDGPWVSLGRFQKPEEALRLDTCRRLGIRWVMRPTGGRAVLHGNDLTCSVAMPLARLGLADTAVRGAYRALAPLLLSALRHAGLPAALGEDTGFVTKGRQQDCFAHVSANDICDARTGAKLAGTALRLHRGAVLMQASIPLGPYPVAPEDVYGEPSDLAPPTIDKLLLVDGLIRWACPQV